MAAATKVHFTAAGTSNTKAGMRRGLQVSLHQCQQTALWVIKHTVTGCLA